MKHNKIKERTTKLDRKEKTKHEGFTTQKNRKLKREIESKTKQRKKNQDNTRQTTSLSQYKRITKEKEPKQCRQIVHDVK